jgi:hypothetical protein
MTQILWLEMCNVDGGAFFPVDMPWERSKEAQVKIMISTYLLGPEFAFYASLAANADSHGATLLLALVSEGRMMLLEGYS